MPRRHKDYNKMLAKEFKSLKFSQAYLVSMVEDEGLSIVEALRETIKAMGIKAFADKAGASIQNVSDFVARRRTFLPETVDKYLEKVFKLKRKETLEKVA